jgi:hypothetical protein
VADTADGQVYIVQTGDTLWSLAQRFYGDPHLWPQLWEQNQYILDSHWIYPGDPLIITGAASPEAFADAQGMVGEPLDTADVAGGPSGMAGDEDPFASLIAETDSDDRMSSSEMGIAGPESGAPVPLGYESDIYCTGYLGDPDEEFAWRIAGSEFDYLSPQLSMRRRDNTVGTYGKASTEKWGLAPGDIIYLDGGRADGLGAGELLTAIEPKDNLRHPETQALLGRLYAYLGRIRVLSVQEETAIAEIIQACDMIPVGSPLKFFEPEPVPLRRITPMRPVNFPVSGEELEDASTIISSVDNLVTDAGLITLGAGYLVLIDQGAIQDTVPGDIFTIYRRSRPGYPPTILGELGVLSVFEHASLARILRSRYAIYTGDPLQIK